MFSQIQPPTDKRYPQKLISLIERYELSKFDKAIAKAAYGKKKIVVTEKKRGVATTVNTVYVVKEGDTLYSISKRYSVSVDDLKRWNYISSDSISVGQKLTVETEKSN